MYNELTHHEWNHIHGYRFLQETPHYLVTKGRHDEARDVFQTMARMNQAPYDETMVENLKDEEKVAVKEKVISIFRAPIVLKRTAVFFLLWYVLLHSVTFCCLSALFM